MTAAPPTSAADLTFDWYEEHSSARLTGIVDETLRDGLQIPDAPAVGLDWKCGILECMSAAGIGDVIIGMAAPQQMDEIATLLRFCGKNGIKTYPWVLCRCSPEELQSLIAFKRREQLAFGLNLFASTSRIRAFVEDWDLARIRHKLAECLYQAKGEFDQIRVAFEDATRTVPDTLLSFALLADELGATRITLADTAGVAVPGTAGRMVSSVLANCPGIRERGSLEWHGHNDRGLATAASLEALYAGANYIHGTMCGIGERNGNLALEEFLMNLSSCECTRTVDFAAIERYRDQVLPVFNRSLESATPFFGAASYASATGTHLAAIEKGLAKGRGDIVKHLFSPPSWLNERRAQRYAISHLTGARGIKLVLAELGFAGTPQEIAAVQELAQMMCRPLTDREVTDCLKSHQRPAPAAPLDL